MGRFLAQLRKGNTMIDTAHLDNRPIIFKLHSVSKAMSGTVVKVEKDHGFWIMGGDLLQMLSSFGSAGMLEKPALFVPFESLEWLLAASESSADHRESYG